MTRKSMRCMAIALAMAAAMSTTACGEADTAGEGVTEASEALATEKDSTSTEAGAESTEAAAESTEGSTEDAAEASSEEASLDGARHRRTLPHRETSDEASTEEEEAENPNAVVEEYPASTEDIVVRKEYKGPTVAFKELAETDAVKVSKKDDSYPETQEDLEEMLGGLAAYWADGNMESVSYLIRMPKFQYLSQMLDVTGDYFYVGEENASGEPDGRGIACYAGNAYYYGEFQDGERSGNGFWYQIFPEDGAYSKANNGIIGHSYNGEWANDLPNGEGQEHVDIDIVYLKDRVVTNVATTFVDGYYNGEIVATTLENDTGMTNWTGEAHYGTMVVIGGEFVENADGEKEVRVLQNVDNEDNYYWMLLDENCGQGITGLI